MWRSGRTRSIRVEVELRGAGDPVLWSSLPVVPSGRICPGSMGSLLVAVWWGVGSAIGVQGQTPTHGRYRAGGSGPSDMRSSARGSGTPPACRASGCVASVWSMPVPERVGVGPTSCGAVLVGMRGVVVGPSREVSRRSGKSGRGRGSGEGHRSRTEEGASWGASVRCR